MLGEESEIRQNSSWAAAVGYKCRVEADLDGLRTACSRFPKGLKGAKTSEFDSVIQYGDNILRGKI